MGKNKCVLYKYTGVLMQCTKVPPEIVVTKKQLASGKNNGGQKKSTQNRGKIHDKKIHFHFASETTLVFNYISVE